MKMSLQPWETSIEDGLRAAVLSGTLTIQGYLALTAADKDVNNGVCSLNATGLPQDKSGNIVSMASELTTHAADTSTHGAVTVADAADLTTHEADTTAIHGITDTSKLAIIVSGSYTGNDTVNRAIPHGLGVVPKLVMVSESTNGSVIKLIRPGYLDYQSETSSIVYAVTTWTTTNFYVGNSSNYTASGNGNTAVYYWVAFG